MQAIETRYKGYRFRSRLEARWAVFFDALGIEWEYEPEGYRLSNGELYLPDFWLPTFEASPLQGRWDRPVDSPKGGTWVEVKPTEAGFAKAEQLALDSGFPTWLATGIPDFREYTVIYPCKGLHDDARCSEDWQFIRDGLHAVSGIPNADQARDSDRMFWEAGYDPREEMDLLGELYVSAVNAARGARFEHGETPLVRH